MIKSRKGQEGFTLIELLVVVLIIGILAAIAIPAFLGQKKGAQDSNAKSLLRNAAISMESYYSENQDFDFAGNGHTDAATAMVAIEPNIAWDAGTDAGANELTVTVNAAFTGYVLNTVSKSTTAFSYARDPNAKTAKCKNATAAAPAPNLAACTGGTW